MSNCLLGAEQTSVAETFMSVSYDYTTKRSRINTEKVPWRPRDEMSPVDTEAN